MVPHCKGNGGSTAVLQFPDRVESPQLPAPAATNMHTQQTLTRTLLADYKLDKSPENAARLAPAGTKLLEQIFFTLFCTGNIK